MTKEKTINSAVEHPDHYMKNTGYEVIEVINAWKLNYNLGNAVKYIARAGKKNPDKLVEDLEKAIFYIRWHIDILNKTKD
tara:strand:- start:639 stop:878 length:240 start_codon:yes stop_codon:yes gene_type:complete